ASAGKTRTRSAGRSPGTWKAPSMAPEPAFDPRPPVRPCVARGRPWRALPPCRWVRGTFKRVLKAFEWILVGWLVPTGGSGCEKGAATARPAARPTEGTMQLSYHAYYFIDTATGECWRTDLRPFLRGYANWKNAAFKNGFMHA